ncbi:ATP-binding cassette domain-containing protein [Lysinibacillus xylanilyticus]|uniref:hypothetical protein n=1 Tax=Lysinibacillus xylanilyticus TaxID=582475 RepID=UPI0038030DFA
MILHDLNLACHYADHIVAIHQQTVAVQGPPEDIMTVAMIQEVLGIEVTLSEGPFLGTPCIPKGKGRYIK